MKPFKIINAIRVLIKKCYLISKVAVNIFDTFYTEDISETSNIVPIKTERVPFESKKDNLKENLLCVLKEINKTHSNWRINIIFCSAIVCLFTTTYILLYFMNTLSKELKIMLKCIIRWLMHILVTILCNDLEKTFFPFQK